MRSIDNPGAAGHRAVGVVAVFSDERVQSGGQTRTADIVAMAAIAPGLGLVCPGAMVWFNVMLTVPFLVLMAAAPDAMLAASR